MPGMKRGRKSDPSGRKKDSSPKETPMEENPIEENLIEENLIEENLIEVTPTKKMEDTSLRRRDRIKSSERYSPPPHKPNKRGGKVTSTGRPVGRPSSVGSRLAPSTSRLSRSGGRDVKSVDVDVKKDVDGKTLISLPDGTTYRVDATHVSISASKEADTAADPDFDPADAGEFEGEDDSYEPSYGARKRMQDPSVGRNLSGKKMKQAASSEKNVTPRSGTRVVKTSSSTDEDKPTPAPTSAPTSALTSAPTSAPTPGPNQRSYTRKTPIRNTEPSIVGIPAGKRPLVQSYSRKSFNVNRSIAAGGINAKEVTITQAHFKHPPKRSYGISAKFIDDLPELFDCTGIPDETEEKYSGGKWVKIPDQILLVRADLPLSYGTVDPVPSITTESVRNVYHSGSDPSSTPHVYAFRQILTSVQTGFPCLLCPSKQPSIAKDEDEMIKHYVHIHELSCHLTSLTIPEDVVYILLPASCIEDDSRGREVVINTPCQHCDLVQRTVSEMKEHYATVHSSPIELIPQERVMESQELLHCHICPDKAFHSFSQLNQHMKSSHSMVTFQCCRCVFFTQQVTRLKSHFKAKHMMNSFGAGAISSSSSSSNDRYSAPPLHCSDCPFCGGVVMGSERMNRHIMTSHCIQTGIGQYSCLLCNQIAGSGDHLTKHSDHCTGLLQSSSLDPSSGLRKDSSKGSLDPSSGATKDTSKRIDDKITHAQQSTSIEGMDQETSDATESIACDMDPSKSSTLDPPKKCFLCDKTFESGTLCDTHIEHVHSKWVPREEDPKPSNGPNDQQVQHGDTGEEKEGGDNKDQEEGTNQEEGEGVSKGTVSKVMKIEDLPSAEVLSKVLIPNPGRHLCTKCDTIITSYPLYYLHMYNVHGLEKVFECKIHDCKSRFNLDGRAYEEHIESSNHPQSSVIEKTLGVICCHFCDAYFADRDSFESHHLTDEHGIRVVSSADPKSAGNSRQEAKNYKCKSCHTWFGLLDSYIHHMEFDLHKYPCPWCGIDFALPSSRRTHIQSHHSDKADICEVCSKKQGSKERLYSHLVDHDIVFECAQCMKKFYQREQLNSHNESHGPPVICKWPGCNKQVKNPSSLSNHVKQHKLIKRCTLCNATCYSLSSYESHMDTCRMATQSAKEIIHGHAQNNPTTFIQINSSNSHQLSSTSSERPSTTSTERPSTTSGGRRRNQVNGGSYGSQFEIPEGLKIMCCTCNQLFGSQPELYSHKCGIKTNKGSSGDARRNQINSLHTNQLNPPLHTVEESEQEEATAAIVEGDEMTALLDGTLASESGQQVLLLEQPDGQVVQICVPADVDINDVLATLAANDPVSQGGVTGEEHVTMNQDGATGEEHVTMNQDGATGEKILMQMVSTTTNDGNEQTGTSDHTDQHTDQGSVVYVPIVQEDGSIQLQVNEYSTSQQ